MLSTKKTSHITVIIPSYNSEKTLVRCLDSCLNQTYGNVDILVINDGSTDSSSSIIERYVKCYENVNVINKGNEGLVAARKTGLDNAKGEYVFFLDSDDYITPNAIELLISEANGADLVIGNILLEDECGHENRFQYFNKLKYGDSREGMYCNYLSKSVIPSLCGRLIRKEYAQGIEVPRFITTGEDCIFNLMILRHINISVRLVDCAIYHYVQYPNSMINSKSSKALSARLFYVKWVISDYEKVDYSSLETKKVISQFVLEEYFSFLRDGGKPENDMDFFNDLKKDYFKKEILLQIPFWRRYMLMLYVFSPFWGNLYASVFSMLRVLLKRK